MNLFFKIIVLLFPAILLGQGVEIKETPKEYLNHIVETWNVDSNKIVYISNETSMVDLAQNLHNSVDRKSTRLNSSHVKISYAVFCLKKKIKYYLKTK